MGDIRSSIGLFCWLSTSLLCPAAFADEPRPRSVLVVDQLEIASAASGSMLASFRSTLKSDFAPLGPVFIENLDLGRFGSPRFERAVHDYFREKYNDKPIDIIVAFGSRALELMLRLRAQVWPEVPVVFSAVDEATLDNLRLPPNVTGLTFDVNLNGPVSVARRVVPGLKRIAIVGDPPARQIIRERVQAQLALLATEIELIDLTGLLVAEIRERVAALPPDSAIVYIGLASDTQNRAYTSYEALVAIAQVANRPIIVQSEPQVGGGALGGIVGSPAAMGAEAARLAIRVLEGENPANIPIATGHFMKLVFDWRQLQRWQISEGLLPPGSEVRFKEAGMWDQYRLQIIVAGAVLLLQTILIGWLLYEHRRRHRAEILARSTISELAQVNRVATAGQLSGSIAHEVAQPLATIVSNADAALIWLRAKVPNIDEARAALTEIVKAGHRAGDVIKSLRAMFNKDVENKTPVDINQLIWTVIAIVQIDLQKHGIELQTNMGIRLPALNANPVQLQQVVLNLVVNAIDSMNLTQHRVLRIQSHVTKNKLIHVAVEDTGAGIEPSDLDNIFKPLFTTKARGMGMGLSICRSVIESHKGRIWVAPGADGGSTFHFELPANGRAA